MGPAVKLYVKSDSRLRMAIPFFVSLQNKDGDPFLPVNAFY